ncbi:amino acid ABC transporter permease [Ruminococcus sp. Marseille-P6503]|uniref:amino acid ABC transporter permease n=1 Tax=Ruminococcus sp. Marseille-P6503 TaxID=2364796 RepID=UPI000F5432C4|nr:amino acid ABC transporter permease [Ruminococcus sp. Marseille-P6503]
MSFEDVLNVGKILLEYLPNTLKLFFWTLALSIPVGVIVTWLKKCRFKPVSWLTNLYILIMRGTPLMLQIIAVYYAIPMLTASARKSGTSNWFYDMLNKVNIRDENYMFTALVVAFVLNYAAYFAEIFRGGIEAIPKGQYEAASMLGMNKFQTFFRIILPQVVKRVIPAASNEVIVLVKDTSLANVIAFAEITLKSKQMMNTYSSVVPLFVAGLFYFVLNAAVTVAFAFIEKKFNYYK